jgi:hypothetical protein
VSAGASCMCITLAYVAVLYAGASRERVRTVSVRMLYVHPTCSPRGGSPWRVAADAAPGSDNRRSRQDPAVIRRRSLLVALVRARRGLCSAPLLT